MRPSLIYLFIGFFASILLLAGVGAYWYRTFQNWNKATQILEHNYQILQSTGNVLSLLKDIEVGQRGFIITRDSSFFTPFENAVVALPLELYRLDSLLPDTKAQQQRAGKLHLLVQKRIYYARKALSAALAPPQVNPHLKTIYMRRGKATMDTVRLLIGNMKDRESAEMPRLNLFKVKFALRSTIALVLSFGLSLALFAGTFFKMVQELFRRLKTEKLLLRNLSELQRSHAQLDDFNFVSVHHLQEPLRKLNIFSDRLQQKHRDDLPEEVQFLVQKLSAAAVEISDLIQDLTAYTTLGKAEEQQVFSEVSIANILQKVQRELEEEITLQFAQVELAEDLPNVEGNPVQLHLLFTHLLNNSLKFARPDEPLRIHLSSSIVAGFEIPGVEDSDHDYTFYRINFTDNGIGIDKKHIGVIFELFQRLHKDKELPGTGIGLAICRKIMLNHNGYIAVKSELNRGSTFSLFFPL